MNDLSRIDVIDLSLANVSGGEYRFHDSGTLEPPPAPAGWQWVRPLQDGIPGTDPNTVMLYGVLGALGVGGYHLMWREDPAK